MILRDPKPASKRRGLRAAVVACVLAALGPATVSAMPKWVVVYSQDVPVGTLFDYDPIVLDSRYHPPLQPLIDRNKTLLGYISIGEVEKYRPHFKEVEREGILLDANENWPDSRFVDMRDPRWTRRVIEELIPAVLHKGFNGIFLDTIDNAAHLERQDPVKYKGMTAAAVQLIKTIRRHYPQIVIMMNRGYDLLPEVAHDIDIVLGESVFADYNFRTKTYQRVAEPLYRRQVEWLKAAKVKAPELKVLTLDYWRPEDAEGIERIYREQRANGFTPYVSTIKLESVIREPSAQ